MKTYNVKSRVSFGRADADGKLKGKVRDYEPGSSIELEDDEAKPLLDAGAIEAPKAEPKKAKGE